jgi:sigma-B regulation protein RsbU (phosphoserine phosphatase)
VADLLVSDIENGMRDSNILVLLPMSTRSGLVGAFLITYDIHSISPGTNPSREEEQLGIIQGISQQTAVAIENIRLIEARQEDAYVTAVLLQVAQAVVGSINLYDTLEEIVNVMPILVGIDTCVIYLWDSENHLFKSEFIYAGSSDIKNELKSEIYSQGEFPILDTIQQTDHSVIIPGIPQLRTPLAWKNLTVTSIAPESNKQLESSTGLLMGFPLSVKGKFFGVLMAEESGSMGGFREKRIEIISGIAQQASLAIQNDRLQKEMVGQERLEREIQLAREIQQTFLPGSVPVISGWELDVRWRPAHQVGGDFYDFFDLPGGKMGLVIADVSDKGLPAALYMAVTRTLIRATVPDFDSPAKVLERVNNLLLLNSHDGLFVTVFYAVLDLRSGRVIYTSAGHNLPIVLRSLSRKVERLSKGGPALGAIGEEIKLKDHTIRIENEDCLVLYTDGVTESFSPSGEIYGEDRLQRVMLESAGASARDLLDSIDQSLIEYLHGEPPGDDTTVMAVRRLPDLSQSSNSQ